MKLLKGIAVYTLIAIGAVIILGLILLGIMFIFPKVKLFGYGFVYRTDKIMQLPNIVISKYDPFSLVSNINLNVVTTDGIGVKVVSSKDDTQGFINVRVHENYYGFYRDSYNTSISAPKITKNDGELNVGINVTGVKGAINYSDDCYVEIQLPKRVNGVGLVNYTYDINIQSENGDVYLDGARSSGKLLWPLLINGLDITTVKGNAELAAVTNDIDHSKASNDKGEIEIIQPKFMYLDKLNLYTKGGEFKFNKIDNIYVGSSTLFNCVKGDFLFNNLLVGTNEQGVFVQDSDAILDIFGDNVLFEAKNLTVANKISYKTDSGVFKVEEAIASVYDQIELETDSASINIGKVLNGQIGARSSYGNITIGTSNNSTYLENNHGSISVDKCNAGIAAITKYGDITIKECTKSATINTERGDINITNIGTVVKKGDDSYKIFISAKKSNIDLTTNVIPFEITSTDSCNVKVTVKDVITAEQVVEEDANNPVSTVKIKGTLNISLPNKDQITLYAKGKLAGGIGTYATGTDIKNETQVVLFEKSENLTDGYVWQNSEFNLTATNINFSTSK